MEKVEPIRDKGVIKDMLGLLKSEGKYRDYLLMTIGFNTALRISDLLELKVKDVRKENGDYHDHIRLREQKTGKNGKHKINKAMEKALDTFFEHNPSKGPEDYLFTTYAGKMTRQRVNQIVKDLTGRFNLEGRYASHSMRKSFGYHALRSGASTDVIQAKFNHSSRRQTLDYCGITDDDVDDIVDNLNLGL